jgi:acetyltransferase-like isoleucine patch superfamily enzyme
MNNLTYRIIRKFFWKSCIRIVQEIQTDNYRVFGEPNRLLIADNCQLNDAIFNVVSGTIQIGSNVFFGHGVSVITGTHNILSFGKSRRDEFPCMGNDIFIDDGVWIGSNATILGPCRIGTNSVIGAMALVRSDVPSYTVVAGIPARVIRSLDPPSS